MVFLSIGNAEKWMLAWVSNLTANISAANQPQKFQTPQVTILEATYQNASRFSILTAI